MLIAQHGASKNGRIEERQLALAPQRDRHAEEAAVTVRAAVREAKACLEAHLGEDSGQRAYLIKLIR